MMYWFAEYPQQPEIFAYSAAQFKADGAHFWRRWRRIYYGGARAIFLSRTTSIYASFCAYRSLNDRGTKAGNLLAAEGGNEGGNDDFDLDLDLDQIAEIEF